MKHDNETQQCKTTYKHSNVTQQWKTTTVQQWKTRMKRTTIVQQSYNNRSTMKNNETQEWENNNCSTIIQESYSKEKQWNMKIKHNNQHNNEEQHWNKAMTHNNDK